MRRVETVSQFVSCIDTSNGLQPELNKTNLTLHCGGGGGGGRGIKLVSRTTERDIRDNSASSVHSLCHFTCLML
jgi:hypothetical protein